MKFLSMENTENYKANKSLRKKLLRGILFTNENISTTLIILLTKKLSNLQTCTPEGTKLFRKLQD